MKSTTAVLVLMLTLSSCASVGRNYNEANISKLQPGVTTEAQAIELLGAKPTTRIYRDDGSYSAVWQYVHMAYIVNTDNKMLHLMFDKNKVYKQLVSRSEKVD